MIIDSGFEGRYGLRL